MTDRLLPFIFYFVTTAILLSAPLHAEPLEVVYRFSLHKVPQEKSYEYQILKMALDKTVADFGPYTLKPSAPMNKKRAAILSENNAVKNLVFRENYNPALDSENLSFIPLPIDLGIFGYRVCFMSEDLYNARIDNPTFDQLKQYSIGQYADWPDTVILRANGFKVREFQQYESMFDLVVQRRFDYLCRGASEVKQEWEEHQHLPGLMLDNTFVLNYPLPRFFWTNSQNTEIIKRLNIGLTRIYDDHSLQDLWRAFFGEAVAFAELEKRNIYYLENPHLKNINIHYLDELYSLDKMKKTGQKRND